MSVELQFEFNLRKFLHEAPLANLGGGHFQMETLIHMTGIPSPY